MASLRTRNRRKDAEGAAPTLNGPENPAGDPQRQPANGVVVTRGCRLTGSAGGATQTEPRPSGLGDGPITIGFKPRRGGRGHRLRGPRPTRRRHLETVEPSNLRPRTGDPRRGYTMTARGRAVMRDPGNAPPTPPDSSLKGCHKTTRRQTLHSTPHNSAAPHSPGTPEATARKPLGPREAGGVQWRDDVVFPRRPPGESEGEDRSGRDGGTVGLRSGGIVTS